MTTRTIPAATMLAAVVLILIGESNAYSLQFKFNFTIGDGIRHHRRPQTRRALSREFLEAHNRIRFQLREVPLVWDRKLARYARRWAAKRAWDCKMIHSYGPYGENIFWGGQDHWTATDAVRSWVTERHHYDANTNSCVPGQMCGHYTQVVWAGTRRLGCSRKRCLNGGVLFFCEYDPPGNYLNENPFGKLFIHPSSPEDIDTDDNTDY